MTIRYRVQRWLESGGSFLDGVGLLEMAGSVAARRHRITAARPFISANEKNALRGDLVRLLNQLPEDEVQPVNISTFKAKPADTPRITALRAQAVTLHKERSDLKSRLLAMSIDNPDKFDDEDRHELAALIMEDNVPALDTIYAQIRRFEEEGIEPADDEEMIRADTVAKMKEVLSLRPRISRLKKAIKGGDESAKTEMQQLQERLGELEAFLGL